jgi:hypothetical protein
VNGKLFIATNHLLEFDSNDFGIQRRLKIYEYKNTFVHDDALVDEAKGFYKLIPIDYDTLPHAKLFYDNQSMSGIPASIRDHTTLPNWRSFAETFLYKDPYGKVRKSLMFRIAVKYFQPVQITEKMLITELQKLTVIYDRQVQHEKERGCFVGVYIRPEGSLMDL